MLAESRVGIACFMQESNTFAPTSTELENFDVSAGTQMLDFFRDTNSEVAGFLDGCASFGWSPVPLTSAIAISGGPLSIACFEELLGSLLRQIAQTPVNGLLIALHGAMTADGIHSADEEIVRRVRQACPTRIPIVVSHDFHANVSKGLLEQVDGLVGYRTYPHIDQRETGQRACNLIARLLKGQKSRHLYVRMPLLLPPQSSSTATGPLRSVMEGLVSTFDEHKGQFASLFCVQPWLDLPTLSSSLVLTLLDESTESIMRDLCSIAQTLWNIRAEFNVDWSTPKELMREVLSTNLKPMLISEAYDSPTGGASGDHTGLLQVLLPHAGATRACIALVDRRFQELARAAGRGATVRAPIGALTDQRYSSPTDIQGQVLQLTDGAFTAKGPAFTGRQFDMGPTAVVSVGGISIVVASRPVMMIDPELYLSQQIEPRAQQVVGVKSSLLFRPAYEDISTSVFNLDMPGPCRGRLELVDFRHVSRPIFPLENFEWHPLSPVSVLPG